MRAFPGLLAAIVLAFIVLSASAQDTATTPTQAPATSLPGAAGQSSAAGALAIPPNWPTAQFASATDPSVRKAAQTLTDMIRALGGDAYLNIQDIKSEGRSYAFYQGKPSGMGVIFWRFQQWPDKDRWEFTKQRDVVELNVGDKGYEITYKGTATQEPKQLDDYNRRRDHSLEWIIRKWLPAAGTMVLYSGTAIVEQNLVDQITVLNAANDSVTLSIDPRNHLPVKKTYQFRDPLDRQFDEDAEVFSNYRVVQGVQTPYSTVRMQNGEMRAQRFLTNVVYNSEIPETMFETKGITYNPAKSVEPK